MAKFILYACPVGALAEQVVTYFERSQQQCGQNAAHAYMPHCTLTGFFEDEKSTLPLYIKAMEKAHSTYRAQIPTPPIEIQAISFRPDWHGLVLQADWLKRLVLTFAEAAESPTRTEALRLKDWLHLSLAYGFEPDAEQPLKQLAQEIVDVAAPADWALRFYEREAGSRWICHRSLPLLRTYP